jgi:hypothetical protein
MKKFEFIKNINLCKDFTAIDILPQFCITKSKVWTSDKGKNGEVYSVVFSWIVFAIAIRYWKFKDKQQ